MLRHIRYLFLTVLGMMLFSVAAHSATNHDPTFDVFHFAIDMTAPVVDVDIPADAIDKNEITYTFENATDPTERYSALSRYSKPVELPADAAIVAFRLNLKAPWQYWQA